MGIHDTNLELQMQRERDQKLKDEICTFIEKRTRELYREIPTDYATLSEFRFKIVGLISKDPYLHHPMTYAPLLGNMNYRF